MLVEEEKKVSELQSKNPAIVTCKCGETYISYFPQNAARTENTFFFAISVAYIRERRVLASAVRGESRKPLFQSSMSSEHIIKNTERSSTHHILSEVINAPHQVRHGSSAEKRDMYHGRERCVCIHVD